MSPTRRDFIKTVGAAGLIVAGSDLIGDLLAQTPPGRVMDSKFKGLSDIALKEAKTARLQLRRHPLHAHDQQRRERQRRQPGPGAIRRRFGGFGGGAARWRARRRRRRRRSAAAADAAGAAAAATACGAAGFGVRVIHSGTWGFASSPIVTEDEIRRITRIATEVARASAIAKKTDVRLAPVPAYQVYWATPIQKDPDVDPARDEAGLRPEGRRRGGQEQGRAERQRVGQRQLRVEVLRVERRLLHRAGIVADQPQLLGHGAQGRRRADAHLQRRPEDGRLGGRGRREDARERRAHRRRGGRVHDREAGRHGREGSRSSPRRTRC